MGTSPGLRGTTPPCPLQRTAPVTYRDDELTQKMNSTRFWGFPPSFFPSENDAPEVPGSARCRSSALPRAAPCCPAPPAPAPHDPSGTRCGAASVRGWAEPSLESGGGFVWLGAGTRATASAVPAPSLLCSESPCLGRTPRRSCSVCSGAVAVILVAKRLL